MRRVPCASLTNLKMLSNFRVRLQEFIGRQLVLILGREEQNLPVKQRKPEIKNRDTSWNSAIYKNKLYYIHIIIIIIIQASNLDLFSATRPNEFTETLSP